jgi:hypothetical protein
MLALSKRSSIQKKFQLIGSTIDANLLFGCIMVSDKMLAHSQASLDQQSPQAFGLFFPRWKLASNGKLESLAGRWRDMAWFYC